MNVKVHCKICIMMHYQISVQKAGKAACLKYKSIVFMLLKCQHACITTEENWSVSNSLEKAKLQFCV